ncbi:MAG TPA: sugar-binding protein [Verrucomicrobiae bacterium]|nr:sugar-binding protein [Verrucomicrobiae bacterium]
MKTIRSVTLGVLLTALCLNCHAASGASTSELLQRGLYAEEVEGNVDSAIKTYAQIIKNSSAPANLVAQALYHQGMCYLKLKDEASARAALERLVTEYPGQTEVVDKARPLLEDLTNFDPATLMPAGTLAYVEFGSPGRQIETVLNMLKDTPFENPLAAVGGQQPGENSQKAGRNVMAALLNPSMMAEFKKLRGSAVGITGFKDNHPEMISVLYPGKSDALRGLILAGLGMAGHPGETLEGMQTVQLPEDMSAAYDDKVVIVARPASQLTWCVRQYKGLTSEPSLASRNEGFARLGKTQRQQNALTLWANVNEGYARLLQMFPDGKVPREILSANAILDFKNIDELTLTETVEPNGLGSKTEIRFKEGHQCLAYDMIRTPNITKAALESVPSEAVAIASFSLNQANATQAESVRTRIQNVTGLDLGRELFANVEQITLFVMPAEASGTDAGSPMGIANRVGLAVTSRNPEQTRQIVARLLGTLSTVASGSNSSTPGRYKIGSQGNQDLYCYVSQANTTTILSLNPAVADASVAAIKNHKSVCTSGPLHAAIDKLDPAASKLVLVNAGGALRFAGSLAKFGKLSDDQLKQVKASFAQLAVAGDKTVIELRTDEQLNRFAANSAITGLPPLQQIIGPMMQLTRVAQEARAETTAWNLRQAAPATIAPAPQPPVIDGKPDSVWNAAKAYQLSGVMYTPPTSTNDLSAEFRTLWDKQNLYVLVNVRDDVLVSDFADGWMDDSVEIYIDADNSKSKQYDDDDGQYLFIWNNGHPKMSRNRPGRTNNIEFAMIKTEAGYCLEAKFPWATLGKKPVTGSKIGFEVKVNDDDDGGDRDTKISWHDEHDNAWKDPQVFGNAELAGLVGWWKFDETQGTVAADSSGNGNQGSLEGNPTWRPSGGRLGGAIELHGGNDHVTIANKAPFDITGQITIAAWVNITSVPQAWTGIVTKGDTAWRLSTQSARNAFHFGAGPMDYLDGRGDVSPGQWHHVLAVYDGDTQSIWVDGKVDASRKRDGAMASNDFPVCIGDNGELRGRCWNGLIDDVRIYNYALAETEIKALAAGEER